MRCLAALLRRHTGFDLGAYKSETVNRRIERRMGIRQISDFEEYVDLLKKEPIECENLAKDMLISVTRFFRDPEVFEHLRQNGRRFMGHALGHGGQQKRLVRLRQQTRLGDGAAAVQGGA